MIFSDPKPLEKLLSEFEEFKFDGGSEWHFVYCAYPGARFLEIVNAVMDKGGFFLCTLIPSSTSIPPIPLSFGSETVWE
jgi:hypothetical protein